VEVDPLAGSLNGHAGVLSFGKIGGARTRMNVNVGYKTPGFEVNDLGFEQRADEIPQSSFFQVRWDAPGTYVRSVRVNVNQWSTHNFDGDRLSLGGNIIAHWQFQNLWSAGFGVDANARRFDDRLTRGGPGGLVEPGVNAWQYLGTNDRRLVSVNWSSSFGGGPQGHHLELQPAVVVRPAPSLSTELGFLYQRNVDDAQWVREVSDASGLHYVFGHLQQQTTSITIRASYTLTPNLSLQVYAQPFTSTGRYANYKELQDGRATDYAHRYDTYAYPGDADFKALSFRTTNVLRWEFKPGSTLFVVWQQRREGEGMSTPFAMGRDYDDVFATPAANALLVKVAYWLNP
jgi:hypothetical protein